MSSFVALVSLVLYMSVLFFLFLKSWFYKVDFLLLEISRNEDKMSISEFPNNFLASYFPIYKEPLDQNSSLTHYGIILESSNF